MMKAPGVGVGIIVYKKDKDKIYIMMHKRIGKRWNGYWGTGGGRFELGESLKESALRELEEEAGPDVRVKNVEFLSVCNFTELQPDHYVDVNFSAEWESGEPVNAEPHNASEWQWFDIDNLPSPLLPTVRQGIEAIQTGQTFFDSKFK